MNSILFAKMDQVFSLKNKQNIKKKAARIGKNTG